MLLFLQYKIQFIQSIAGLQTTDVELDARVTALEENGGGGNIVNGEETIHNTCLNAFLFLF